MKRFVQSATLGVALFGLAGFMTGCDREIAHTKETKIQDDGTVKTKEKSVTENSDGGVTVTEEKSTTDPN